MLDSKTEMTEWLKYEKEKYGRIKSLARFFPISEKDFLWKYNWILRHLEYHMNNKHMLLTFYYKFRHNRYSVKTNIHIPPNTCGRGLKIMHVGPILINGKARLGEDISIHVNTSVVAQGNNGGVPQIGNNVVIGVGAVILGAVYIADGIAIGANAVVNKSFEETNIAIAGVPAKKISNNGKGTWQIKEDIRN